LLHFADRRPAALAWDPRLLKQGKPSKEFEMTRCLTFAVVISLISFLNFGPFGKARSGNAHGQPYMTDGLSLCDGDSDAGLDL
jgi:hypothetical protein